MYAYYPYHSYQDPGQQFIGALIPALILYGIAVAIFFLVRYRRHLPREGVAEERSPIPGYIALGFAEILKLICFLFIGIFRFARFILRKIFQLIRGLIRKRQADNSQSDKGTDKYRV